MELSAKITSSVYLYLESQGALGGECLEQAGLAVESALDTERWVSIEQVEQFLACTQSAYSQISDFSKVAHKAVSLKSWGLLDQVLRIVGSPLEIYEKPQTFLSYFLKEIQVTELEVASDKKQSQFQLDQSLDLFPLVGAYLRGALEVVPLFSGESLARVSLGESGRVLVDWSEGPLPQNADQQLEMEASPQIAPSKNKEEEILKKLEDYFLRSRQLVSLLRADSGKKKWFKQALKRLKWDELEGLFQENIQELKSSLEHKIKQ